MKKQPYTLFIALAICCAGILNSQTMPVYLNFNSHNETDDPNDYSQSGTYSQVKSIVIAMADTIGSNGARWNMQVESNFILGCINNDNASTDPNDLLDSLDNLAHVEVDPHNHFDPIPSSQSYNPYNYADLAHLLDSCGLATPRKNMGGFLWQTASDWMPYQVGDTGFTFNNYIWHPNVVWGGGSPGHVNDFNAYGIWKPNGAGVGQFDSHNPLRNLTCIGNGCSNVLSDSTPVSDNINQIINLINYIATQPYDPNAYWTASIQFNFRDINMPGLADSIATIIHALEPYVTSGQIVWMTLTEKYDNWYTLHTNPNDHFIATCDTLYLSANSINAESDLSMFPNPFESGLTISSSELFNTIALFDASGRMIYRKETGDVTSTIVESEGMDSGYYVVIVSMSDGSFISRRVVKY